MGVIYLIARMSRNISSYFVAQDIIQQEDIDVYAYSFEILISALMSSIALVILAVLSKTILYSALYLLGFIPLRLIAGGYHAKSHFRCFTILVISYSVFLLLISFLPAQIISPTLLLVALSLSLVFMFAPIVDRNKPISSLKIVQLKKMSRVYILLVAPVICMLAVLVHDNRVGFSLAMGTFTVSISLLAGHIRTDILYRKKNFKGEEES